MRSHDADLDTADDRSRGAIAGLLTLPFRAVGSVLGIVVRLVTFLGLAVAVPARLAVGAVRSVTNLAADLVYALWRAAMGVVRAVLAAFGLLIGAVTALIGLVRRLIMALFGLLFTLVAAVAKLVKVALTIVAIPIAAVVGIAITIGRVVAKLVTTVLAVVLGVVLAPLRLVGIGRRKDRVEYVAVHDEVEADHVPDAA